VYNGERYLSRALDSILGQDYPDFELVVADNASTDRTFEIVNEYARHDRRISIHRSDSNKGVAWNFNRCVDLAVGHYFKWVACDDEMDPTFLSRSVELMDREPGVVLCYSRVRQIDQHGELIQELPAWSAMESSPRQRVRNALLFMQDCSIMFGLTRREQLLTSQRERSYAASDRAMLAQLALMGKLYEIPEVLLSDRAHSERSGGAHHDRRTREVFINPRRSARWSLPRWRLLFGYVGAFSTAPVPVADRLTALAEIPRWVVKQKGNLAFDVVRVLKPIR
jgi:glycosyltransferase involved in cell wall biosynthesis